MIPRQLFLLFCIFFFTSVFAQQTPGFNIRQYGTEDGLPSNGIKGLQWDKETGFLWIATEAGIVRFNGMNFKTFTGEDDNHITNERILFLIRNNAGRIFTADNTGNIFTVEKNSLSFTDKKKIAGNSRTNIVTLAASDSFFKTSREISNGPFSFQFDRILPVSDTSMFLLHMGHLYYLSISMTVPEPLNTPFTSVSSAFKCEDDFFITDNLNRFWYINKETFSFSPVDFFFEQTKAQPDINRSQLIWENGMKWPVFFDGDKAWKISYTGGRLVARFICGQIPQNSLIRFAKYDESDNKLFIGTDSKGVIIITQNRVEPVRKSNSSIQERTSYYSQVELPDGNVMTNAGHILGKNDPENSLPPFSGIFSISSYMSGDSVFWFVRSNPELKITCLHSYNFLTKQLKAYSKIRENFSQLVIAYSGGSLYFTNETGIYRMQGDSLEKVFAYPSSERLHTHFDMEEIRPGVLAIANCNALLQYDISKHKLDTIFPAGKYCVRTIWRYKDYLFFGTYGNGLYISRNGKVKPLPLDKNNYLLFTHCFVQDKNDFCWISTNRGLFKASIPEMINAYETGAAQVYYHYFGRNDGMDMTEMNGGCKPCALVMKNGTISFPTMEGLIWVNPAIAKPVLPSGEIFIDEVLVDNKQTKVSALESISLSPVSHDFIFRLGFSAWSNKENIYLQYKLNNAQEWKLVNTDNGAVIQIDNLKKGDYTLSIRKLNGFGVNNYSYKTIRFSIPAPWYQRWWFYLLTLIFASGLITLYIRFRTRQYTIRQRKLEKQVAEKTKELQSQNEVLEKNNSIKTRLISIISHDIVTPLKFLTVAGKKLVENRKVMPEELQEETIREMTNTSQELQLLSTNILNWIKYQNENRRMVKETFDLHEMTAQVFGILQSLAKQKNLVILNKTNPGTEVYQYYEPLKILLYNLLTNAIHFSEKGTITVNAVKENGNIILSVKDEGAGMTQEQVQRLMQAEVIITSANIDNRKGHGLGFLIIKDLVKTMNASLHIESKKDEGTTVFVKMPATGNNVS